MSPVMTACWPSDSTTTETWPGVWPGVGIEADAAVEAVVDRHEVGPTGGDDRRDRVAEDVVAVGHRRRLPVLELGLRRTRSGRWGTWAPTGRRRGVVFQPTWSTCRWVHTTASIDVRPGSRRRPGRRGTAAAGCASPGWRASLSLPTHVSTAMRVPSSSITRHWMRLQQVAVVVDEASRRARDARWATALTPALSSPWNRNFGDVFVSDLDDGRDRCSSDLPGAHGGTLDALQQGDQGGRTWTSGCRTPSAGHRRATPASSRSTRRGPRPSVSIRCGCPSTSSSSTATTRATRTTSRACSTSAPTRGSSTRSWP